MVHVLLRSVNIMDTINYWQNLDSDKNIQSSGKISSFHGSTPDEFH